MGFIQSEKFLQHYSHCLYAEYIKNYTNENNNYVNSADISLFFSYMVPFSKNYIYWQSFYGVGFKGLEHEPNHVSHGLHQTVEVHLSRL